MRSWDDFCEICGGVCHDSDLIKLDALQPASATTKPFSTYIDHLVVHKDCFDLFKKWFGREFNCSDAYTKDKVDIPLSKYHSNWFNWEQFENDFNSHLLSVEDYLEEVWKPHFGISSSTRVVTLINPPEDVSEYNDVLQELKEAMSRIDRLKISDRLVASEGQRPEHKSIEIILCNYYQNFILDYSIGGDIELTLTDLWRSCCEFERWRYSRKPDEILHTFLKGIAGSIRTSNPEKMSEMFLLYGVSVSPSSFIK